MIVQNKYSWIRCWSLERVCWVQVGKSEKQNANSNLWTFNEYSVDLHWNKSFEFLESSEFCKFSWHGCRKKSLKGPHLEVFFRGPKIDKSLGFLRRTLRWDPRLYTLPRGGCLACTFGACSYAACFWLLLADSGLVLSGPWFIIVYLAARSW